MRENRLQECLKECNGSMIKASMTIERYNTSGHGRPLMSVGGGGLLSLFTESLSPHKIYLVISLPDILTELP
jgi:hypothetical protein